MTDTRVVIDLNETHPDGLSMVLLSQVEGELEVGATVRAVEPEDGVCAPALVVSKNTERGFALVRVDWEKLRKDDEILPTQTMVGNIYFGFANSHIHVANPDGLPIKLYSNLAAQTFGVSNIKRSYSRESGLQAPRLQQQTSDSELVA